MKTSEMKVITLTGSPFEQGRIHGELLKNQVRDIIERFKRSIVLDRRMDPELYIKEFLDYGLFDDAVQQWTPQLWQEMKGIAQGADVDFDMIRALQYGDEEWVYGQYYHNAPAPHKCTSFALMPQSGHPAYAGQNMDAQSWIDGRQVLFHIKDEKNSLESFVFSHAGLTGLNGMNSAGLGVCCNTLIQLGSCRDGLPVGAVMRGVLACKTFEEASNFLYNIKHASGQNYIVSTRDKIGCFECSADFVVEYKPASYPNRVCHSNHPLTNKDTQHYDNHIKMHSEAGMLTTKKNSKARYASIERRLCANNNKVTLNDIKNALSSFDDLKNPVCRELQPDDPHGLINFTTGSMIYEFGDELKLHLASGPPSITKYKIFNFQG
ncbi:MAG: C45 family peptidase [Thermodesulfobacteriota bacterium]